MIAAIPFGDQFRLLRKTNKLFETGADAVRQTAIVVRIQQAAVQMDIGVFLQMLDRHIEHQIKPTFINLPPFGANQTHNQSGGQMADVDREVGINFFHVLIARALRVFDEIMLQQPLLPVFLHPFLI